MCVFMILLINLSYNLQFCSKKIDKKWFYVCQRKNKYFWYLCINYNLLKHLQFTIYNLQFTIYNLQIIFADLKKIMGDTYAFTIYNLQIINYFSPTKKKSWVIHMHLQFTIYKLFLPT